VTPTRAHVPRTLVVNPIGAHKAAFGQKSHSLANSPVMWPGVEGLPCIVVQECTVLPPPGMPGVLQVASVSGDVRRSLELCRRGAEICDEEQAQTADAGGMPAAQVLVSIAHVNKAVGEAFRAVHFLVLEKAPSLEKILLAALLLEIKATGAWWEGQRGNRDWAPNQSASSMGFLYTLSAQERLAGFLLVRSPSCCAVSCGRSAAHLPARSLCGLSILVTG
jgi:hypothetical protein